MPIKKTLSLHSAHLLMWRANMYSLVGHIKLEIFSFPRILTFPPGFSQASVLIKNESKPICVSLPFPLWWCSFNDAYLHESHWNNHLTKRGLNAKLFKYSVRKL